MHSLRRIVTGGQTGVDQAALRAARACGLELGGWCPPGRVCDAGEIPAEFPLVETPEERSLRAPSVPRSQRTEWNVRDSDATLILLPVVATMDMGTTWTLECCEERGCPFWVQDVADPQAAARVSEWLEGRFPAINCLHVAGPSERRCPGIGDQTYRLLMRLLRGIAQTERLL